VPILVLLPVNEISSSKLRRILTLEHVTLINRSLRIAIFFDTVVAKLRDRMRPDSLLAEVRSLMDVRASEKGIPLEIEFADTIPESIETDAVKVRQVLLNLIGNAIKFTDKGEVKVVCRYDRGIGVQPVDIDKDKLDAHPTLVFEIIDTGFGIKPEDQPALFEPFVQADNTSTRSFGGTGLGLAICRRLAHALGGQVSLESEFGKGSKFTFTIQVVAVGPLVAINLLRTVAEEIP